jgi:translin
VELEKSITVERISMAKEVVSQSVQQARGELDTLDSVREKLIRLSRDIIRSSGWAIVEVHKGNLPKAREYLTVCEGKTRELIELARKHPQLLYTGLVNNAVSEYVEAKLFVTLITEGRLPSLQELSETGIPLVPYLQGLGDLVGELKRLSLELVRQGRYDISWLLLDLAETIYLELQALDYPDAILPGIRRKADIARRIVDDLKGMLIDLSKREKLARLLQENIEKLSNTKAKEPC